MPDFEIQRQRLRLFPPGLQYQIYLSSQTLLEQCFDVIYNLLVFLQEKVTGKTGFRSSKLRIRSLPQVSGFEPRMGNVSLYTIGLIFAVPALVLQVIHGFQYNMHYSRRMAPYAPVSAAYEGGELIDIPVGQYEVHDITPQPEVAMDARTNKKPGAFHLFDTSDESVLCVKAESINIDRLEPDPDEVARRNRPRIYSKTKALEYEQEDKVAAEKLINRARRAIKEDPLTLLQTKNTILNKSSLNTEMRSVPLSTAASHGFSEQSLEGVGHKVARHERAPANEVDNAEVWHTPNEMDSDESTQPYVDLLFSKLDKAATAKAKDKKGRTQPDDEEFVPTVSPQTSGVCVMGSVPSSVDIGLRLSPYTPLFFWEGRDGSRIFDFEYSTSNPGVIYPNSEFVSGLVDVLRFHDNSDEFFQFGRIYNQDDITEELQKELIRARNQQEARLAELRRYGMMPEHLQHMPISIRSMVDDVVAGVESMVQALRAESEEFPFMEKDQEDEMDPEKEREELARMNEEMEEEPLPLDEDMAIENFENEPRVYSADLARSIEDQHATESMVERSHHTEMAVPLSELRQVYLEHPGNTSVYREDHETCVDESIFRFEAKDRKRMSAQIREAAYLPTDSEYYSAPYPVALGPHPPAELFTRHPVCLSDAQWTPLAQLYMAWPIFLPQVAPGMVVIARAVLELQIFAPKNEVYTFRRINAEQNPHRLSHVSGVTKQVRSELNTMCNFLGSAPSRVVGRMLYSISQRVALIRMRPTNDRIWLYQTIGIGYDILRILSIAVNIPLATFRQWQRALRTSPESKRLSKYMFVGNQGSGKTYLAKVIAGECRADMYCFPLTDIRRMKNGVIRVAEDSRSWLMAFFRKGVQLRNAPVLIMDEVSRLNVSRRKTSQFIFSRTGQLNLKSEQKIQDEQIMMGLFTEVLVQIDGVKGRLVELGLLIGTAREFEQLDPALLRPGRFGNILFLEKPGMTQRREVFESYLNAWYRGPAPRWPVQLPTLVRMTHGYSQARLHMLCSRATLDFLHMRRMGRLSYSDVTEFQSLQLKHLTKIIEIDRQMYFDQDRELQRELITHAQRAPLPMKGVLRARPACYGTRAVTPELPIGLPDVGPLIPPEVFIRDTEKDTALRKWMARPIGKYDSAKTVRERLNERFPHRPPRKRRKLRTWTPVIPEPLSAPVEVAVAEAADEPKAESQIESQVESAEEQADQSASDASTEETSPAGTTTQLDADAENPGGIDPKPDAGGIDPDPGAESDETLDSPDDPGTNPSGDSKS